MERAKECRKIAHIYIYIYSSLLEWKRKTAVETLGGTKSQEKNKRK